jgi:hypothetical protein
MTTPSSGRPAHTDARTFARLLAAACLVLGPLAFLVGSAVDPAWDDDSATYLAEVAEAPGRYQLAGLLGLVGAILTVVGLLGVIHLLRGPRVTLAQVGASLVLVGAVCVAGMSVVNIFEAVGTGSEYDRAMMVDYFDAVEESGWAMVFFVAFIGGLMLGTLLLAIGLFLQRDAAPVWVPVLLLAYIVASFFSVGQLMSVASSALLVIALGGLAARIVTVSDDDWSRWTVLPDQGRRRHGAGARDSAGTSA